MYMYVYAVAKKRSEVDSWPLPLKLQWPRYLSLL